MSQFFNETAHNRINRKIYGENHDGIDWSGVGGKKPVAPAVEPKKKKVKWLVEEHAIPEGDFDEFIDEANSIRIKMMAEGFTKFTVEFVQNTSFAEDGGKLMVVSKKEK